ncbi:hypothetical protein [Streptomyces sp. NPDC058701]|uniref:hypothetical protein n=1 Tax=Streptomyces sp. NPDC058701 TaxID=3346608 RepID=UPI003662E046
MSARSFPLNAEGHITPCNRCFTARACFASLSALIALIALIARNGFTPFAQFPRGPSNIDGGRNAPHTRYRDRLPPFRTTARAGRFPTPAGEAAGGAATLPEDRRMAVGRRQLAPDAAEYVPGPLVELVQSTAKTVGFQLFPAKF